MSALASAPATTSTDPLAASTSFWSAVRRSPLAIGTVVFLAALIAACALANVIAPYHPQAQDLTAVLQGPSSHHLLGTDTLGRDVLSRLLYGGRRSLLSVAEGLGVVLVLGIPLGLAAGYAGKWVDRTIGAVSEMLMAIPAIMLVLLVLAVRPHDENAAMVAFGLLGAPTVMRVVRAATLKVREELYVAAARVSGVAPLRLVVRHVVPRTLGPIIVQASLFCAYALTFETGLAFLGVTGGSSTPTWGGMVGEASTVIQQQSWLLFPSSLTIAVTIVAFGLLGDAVRDAAVGDRPARRRRRRRPSARSGVPGSTAAAVPAPNGATPGAHGATPSANGTAPTANGAAPAAERSGALLEVDDLVIVAEGDTADTTLVDRVSFHVGEGETLGIVGESGCGKTVTALGVLRLLPSGLAVSGGRVRFEGHDLLALDDGAFDRLRGSTIAYVSQEPQTCLDPTFRVGSQLIEVIRHHDGVGRAAARRRAIELLALVELPSPEQVARAYPHELSGGMAQRVALALALAGRPRLLIADEPTTALDVTVQAEILACLRHLQAETGVAVVIITHNWGVVADLCDRTVVMYAGQVVEEATVQEMFDQPLHPYTLGLLAAHPSLARPGEPMVAMPGRVPAPGSWPTGCRFADRCAFVTPDCQARSIPLLQDGDDRVSRCVRVGELAEEVGVR